MGVVVCHMLNSTCFNLSRFNQWTSTSAKPFFFSNRTSTWSTTGTGEVLGGRNTGAEVCNSVDFIMLKHGNVANDDAIMMPNFIIECSSVLNLFDHE